VDVYRGGDLRKMKTTTSSRAAWDARAITNASLFNIARFIYSDSGTTRMVKKLKL
jgi:hypothetical protein